MEKRLMRIFFLLTTVGIILSGCKPGQGLGGKPSVTDLAIAAQPDFSSLDIKRMTVKVLMADGTSLTCPASCRIVRDSVVHLSVTPFFGIEAMVAQLTRDRFLVLDKLRKVAYTGSYEELEKQTGIAINFTVVQALLTNRLFILNKEGGPLNRLKAETNRGIVSLHHTQLPVKQQFVLNEANRIQETSISAVVGNYHFTNRYDGFSNQDLLVFPYQQTMNLEAGKKKYELSLSITRMTVNEKPAIPQLSIQGYRIGTIEQLMK